jgi:hypothetical protein
MKIERIIYGMQTGDGKIFVVKTAGVNSLLTTQSFERIKKLTSADSHCYLHFPTERTLAYSIIIDVADKDPKHGGRTWVQNQTFLVSIKDFLDYTQSGKNPFAAFDALVQPSYSQFPQFFEAVNV